MKFIIKPAPQSRRYPYTRWATMREDGYGRIVTCFCHALKFCRDLDRAANGN